MESIRAAKAARVHVSAVGLAAEVHICREMAKASPPARRRLPPAACQPREDAAAALPALPDAPKQTRMNLH